jgi:GWxTD domain-containing protein
MFLISVWRNMLRHSRVILAGALLVVLLSGCGGPPPIDEYRYGRSSRFAPGIPSFDIETVPSEPGHPPGLDVYLSVPSTSWTFVKGGEQFRAMSEVDIRLLGAEGRVILLENSWSDTTVVPSYAATQRYDPFILVHHINAPPGECEVEVTFENLSSRKSEVRRQTIDVPDSALRSPYIGKALVEAQTDRGIMLPVVSPHVPSGLDSLRCVVKLLNLNLAASSMADLDVVRYRSDTTVATPPYLLTSFDLPLGYSGVEFEKPDTVLAHSRMIPAGTSEVRLVIGLRGLPPGNYLAAFQMQASTGETDSHDTLLRAERFMSMGGPTFPRPSTLPELIEAMVYIARREEMKLLRSAPTPEIARARFDSLWLSFRPDKREAATLINRYYSRVAEANRRYTRTKEGWKTDQGMLYIVLGPPVDVVNSKDQQVWYYDLRGDDASNTYTFQRRIVRNGSVTLEKYTLYRQPYYENFWNRMVDKWRSGEVF